MNSSASRDDIRSVPGVASARVRFVIVSSAEHYAAGMAPMAAARVDAPMHCAIRLSRERRPMVTLQEMIGGTAVYSPDQLRVIAAKLNAIAADAEKHPDGRPDFIPSYRRY